MTTSSTPSDAATPARPPVPVIVHLSGRMRGRTQRLGGDTLRIGAGEQAQVRLDRCEITCCGEGAEGPSSRFDVVATLQRRGASYRMAATPGTAIWVNGERATDMVLASGDVIEIGQGGPLLRFRLYAPGSRAYKTLGEAFADCVDCARKADTRLARRTGLVVSGVARELATQISPLLRLVLVAGIVGVVALGGRLWITSVRLEQRIAAQTVRIRGLSALLDRAERDRITVNDLEARRDELEKRMSRTVSRLDALEARGEARERVIAAASGSVAFLQGGYGFEEEASHRRLRYVLDAGGAPQTGPDGSPLLTFDGDGTEVEILFTGTGFAVGEGRRLITNRHVAVPWEFDSSTQAIVAQGLTPVMNRMIGFLPHRAEPFDVRLLRTSDSADLALLAIAPDHPAVAPLVLSDAPPHVGDEVLVLGFPAGVQALIARADPVFVTGLMERGPPGFWDVTRDLAKEGYIAPLATMGIIGQITRTRVVYDADTTHGGSGGPVLSMDGTVLAVNSAIIPDFGGSNLGVPAREAHALLDVAADARP